MRIITFIAKRLIFLIPTLLGIVILLFLISHVIPADPAALIAGPYADKKQVEEIRHMYGFDLPLHEQLWAYLIQLVKGDLGESLFTRRPVIWEIKNRFAATLELALTSLFLSVILGIPVGVYTAIKRNKWTDHLFRGITIAGLAIATFWLGILLQLFFGYRLDLLPIASRISGDPPQSLTGLYLVDSLLTLNGRAFLSSIQHILLPVTALTLPSFATLVRFTRAGVLNALNSEYVRYERSMGLPRHLLIYKYVLRNSLTATVSQIGLLFGVKLAGSVVIERVFSWPGLGTFAVESILMMDYKAVLAVALWAGVAYTLGNLIVDVLLAVIDPRETAR
jgi:ABC-type dipeptide/oligopeptide/nickel transport system permease component